VRYTPLATDGEDHRQPRPTPELLPTMANSAGPSSGTDWRGVPRYCLASQEYCGTPGGPSAPKPRLDGNCISGVTPDSGDDGLNKTNPVVRKKP